MSILRNTWQHGENVRTVYLFRASGGGSSAQYSSAILPKVLNKGAIKASAGAAVANLA